jgi:disulfide bond formation protein DsbB
MFHYIDFHLVYQGFIYIFFSYQTWFGRIFWILVILLMTILGLYWCIKAYLDWQDKPVLTTVTTTALPVTSVSHRNL